MMTDELRANEHPVSWTNPHPKGVYDLVVIGAGPAGLTAATLAAAKGHKVAVLERDLIGGECFNSGCIPSKTLIRTSRLYADMRNAKNFGGEVPEKITVDFAAVMARMCRVREQISGHISVEQLQKRHIDVYFGEAAFSGSKTIRIADQTLSFRKAIIATGARPYIPAIPGLHQAGFHTNETIFKLDVLPPSLLVIGGGAQGCELAQAFCRLGSNVTIVQRDPMFLDNVERDGAQILSDALANDGVRVFLNTEVVNVQCDGATKIVDLLSDDVKTRVVVSAILVGTGQTPNADKLNLAAAGIRVDRHGGVLVDDYLRTDNRRVYAVGNVCAEQKMTHIPDTAARVAVTNAVMFGRQKVKDAFIPWCIYTDPEIAHVGIQVLEAREFGIPVKTFTVLMHQVDRAIADSEDIGFVKIHVREGSDTILGATVVSRHAGDIINSVSLAIVSGIGLRALATVDYPYPTQGDVIKMVAAAYLRTAYRSSLYEAVYLWWDKIKSWNEKRNVVNPL